MIEKNKLDGSSIIKGNEIDLIALARTIWEERKIIYNSIGVVLVLGIMVAFLSPVKYTVTATILPSVQKKSSSVGNLSALAGMAGINLGSMMGESNGIAAEIYPRIVNSYPFLNEFIHEKFNFKDYRDALSIYEYVLKDTVGSFGQQLLKYTIHLPWTIKNKVFSSRIEGDGMQNYGVLSLTEDEVKAYQFIEDLFMVSVDDQTGLVSLTVVSDEPILTAQYVQKGIELLQRYIIDYKTKQARENLNFIQARYDEKRVEYQRLQKVVFNYRDSHRNVIAERLDVEYQRINDEYELISSIFNELARQLEQSKIAVEEQKPAFTVIEPAKIPIKRSSPKRISIIVVSLFIGLFGGISLILIKLLIANLKKGWGNSIC
nr:Wzz/FepE/Etk N-terminal domain-containing protein [uncultured Carboxylicivirga sp.]